MGHLYNNNLTLVKKSKPLYFSSKIWRSMFLIASNPMHHYSEKKIWNRSSTVPITYIGKEVIIHNGKKWKVRYVNRWMVGFKFGSFTWNRKYAIFKKKAKKKKK